MASASSRLRGSSFRDEGEQSNEEFAWFLTMPEADQLPSGSDPRVGGRRKWLDTCAKWCPLGKKHFRMGNWTVDEEIIGRRVNWLM